MMRGSLAEHPAHGRVQATDVTDVGRPPGPASRLPLTALVTVRRGADWGLGLGRPWRRTRMVADGKAGLEEFATQTMACLHKPWQRHLAGSYRL
ncbi:hypothetical protein XHV734_4715 [Xanthomonas hortorum pv. vitians]|nr:hypothetical protein XHV734_4715 [Xanthomonas hortorum pv. vitians]